MAYNYNNININITKIAWGVNPFPENYFKHLSLKKIILIISFKYFMHILVFS